MSASLLGYLRVLGLEHKEDLSLGDLKKAFRSKVLEAHPDKGGEANDFDYLLSAFTYITNTICRVKGGRATTSDIGTPDDLKASRVNEFIESVFEEYNREQFNKEFEKIHISDINDGYSSWFSSDPINDITNNKEITTDDFNYIDLKNYYQDYLLTDAKINKTYSNEIGNDISKLNSVFIKKVKKGKPEPQSIILHPSAMAYNSGSLMGSSLVGLGDKPDSYTSDFLSNPEYTDLYQAYTNENTIYDKVSDNILTRTFDDIINERKGDIKPFTDNEKAELFEYERKQLQKEKERIDKLNETYKTNYTYKTTLLENNIVYGENSFIRQIN